MSNNNNTFRESIPKYTYNMLPNNVQNNYIIDPNNSTRDNPMYKLISTNQKEKFISFKKQLISEEQYHKLNESLKSKYIPIYKKLTNKEINNNKYLNPLKSINLREIISNQEYNKSDSKYFYKIFKYFPKDNILKTSQNEYTKKKNNLLIKWELFDVPGDGTCGYHAIMKYYKLMKDMLPGYFTLPEIFKNYINTKQELNKTLGFALRNFIATKLKEEKTIYSKKIDFTRKFHYVNIENNINKGKLITAAKSIDEWMDDEMFYVTAQILKKYIFILTKSIKENSWVVYTPYGSKKLNGNDIPTKFNSIFLLHKDQSHFLAMLPKKEYTFKERFNGFNPDKFTFSEIELRNKFLKKNFVNIVSA